MTKKEIIEYVLVCLFLVTLVGGAIVLSLRETQREIDKKEHELYGEFHGYCRHDPSNCVPIYLLDK